MNKQVLPNRRKYNQWVANETLEDYALRYTAKKSRRWSTGWVANTALGVISFLALEAIGGAITLEYGFVNAMAAILVVGGIIFLSALPISYYAARDGVDIDLLTRGAGFGYIGSTISSLIYASFTFIFFALEAAIMSMAINMITGLSLSVAYFISALVVIPLVTHGFSRISHFQAWTQPVWLILQVLPLVFIVIHESQAFELWVNYQGVNSQGNLNSDGQGFNWLLFGAAAAIIFPLIAQNGEQADFLRFLPVRNEHNKKQWWLAVIGAGPGWVVFGIIKLFVGSFLAVLALSQGIELNLASDPAHMYAMAFNYITSNPDLALWIMGVFVVISQLKINVTNAYAGSIAWGNFFSRLTHSHPGRVVWLFFNVAIALLLMELGLYQAFETILITYGCLVVAWVGSLVADLVINKPLGLSPAHIEFRRGHLYDINPVGVVSMTFASIIGIVAHLGLFGEVAQAMATFLALLIPFITVPLIAWFTKGRYYLCREEGGEESKEQHQHAQVATEQAFQIIPSNHQKDCHICENNFDHDDMVQCPSYEGHICSLCCALDTRCNDQCRPKAHLAAQVANVAQKLLPEFIYKHLHSVVGQFLGIFLITSGIIACLFVLVYYAQTNQSTNDLNLIADILWQVYFLLLLVTGILIWLYVLAQESNRFALKETELQTELLTQEVQAHEITAVELEKARDTANVANRAKSRYLSGVSHELRTPLNTIFGYAQLMENNHDTDSKSKKIASVIKRSSEHLSDVIEGLLEISKIEARKLDLHKDNVNIKLMIQQLEDMFRPQAEVKNIDFKVTYQTDCPTMVAVDEKRLRQVLLNLLSNAIKFTREGEVELKVTYRNQVANIIVRDTGIGIAEADKQKIFEPFERIKDKQTQNISGTGLGLTISRLMIEMMGGNIEVTSQPGQGTEFCLKLFLPSVTKAHTIESIQMDIQGYHGDRRHIMIVDDEQSHRSLIGELLQPLGFEVCTADSAENALAHDNLQRVDLFLLDISMPGMSGWELVEQLRQQKYQQPIIIVSADPYSAEQLQDDGLDIQAYINKPVVFEKLLKHVQRSLSLQWIRAEKIEPKTSKNNDKNEQTDIVLDGQLINELEKYARIGYLKGVLECVEKIDSLQLETKWGSNLKQLAEHCDLNGIIKVVEELKRTVN